MKTISQTRRENNPIYEVNIDFDAASEAWKANKRSIGNGSYRYVCCKKVVKFNPIHKCSYACLIKYI